MSTRSLFGRARGYTVAGIALVGLVSLGLVAAAHYGGSRRASAPAVDFNRDVRPILNQTCVSCHGGVRQKNGVSFIYRDEALGKGTSGRRTIVPGHPEASELIARVSSTDPEVRMPYHAPPLPPQQIALLKQWIKEGAHWEDHWAFVAPKPQTLPAVKRGQWPIQPLDRFILARLEREHLEPSSEATKEALLRRVSFDLTGLPPTAEELSDFLADASTNAYDRQVDRLLASPRYGERWAALWLDLARYADSRGYEKDNDRSTWPYRDWVIDAFNQNLPYDRFVITQLAGDLFPHPTFADRIATSFQRQTPVNDEGGTDDEEFRLVAVMDRVATTWSVLNGLTINCVQCHSHPYDPIRHVEYYKFLAFFNTSQDADLDADLPTLPVPKSGAHLTEVTQLTDQRTHVLHDIVDEGRALKEQTTWQALPIATGVVNEVPALERALRQLELARRKGRNPDPEHLSARGLKKFYARAIAGATADLKQAKRESHLIALKEDHGGVLAVGTIPLRSVFELRTEPIPDRVTALRIEAPTENPATAQHSPENGFLVDRIDVWVMAPNGHEQKVTFRYFLPDSEQNLDRAAKPPDVFRESADIPLGGLAGFAANSKLFQTRWIIAIPDSALTLPPGSRLKVQLLNGQDIDARPASPKRIKLYTSSDERWIEPAEQQLLTTKLTQLRHVEARLWKIPNVSLPVMVEQAPYEQRQTLEFERGNFLSKVGLPLRADIPGVFPKLAPNLARNRLTMASWFFAPNQPLTARVAVNRYWEQLFGTGLVETLEDFGSSGLPPSHPQLLDWLALHFQNDLKWDMKALLRELVTSATYMQSAKVSPSLLARDPRNRLLARGPQQRLSAEMVRDQAMLASGLLNATMGGPPVMPPQPAGLWMTVYNEDKWVDAKGPNRYRRSIYTYLKRSALYPSLATFDAADHVVSLPRRIPTNTPLQALVTLNDPAFQEASHALAQRMLQVTATVVSPTHHANTQAVLEARLDEGARRVLSRDLSPDELKTVVAFYEGLRPAQPGASMNELTAFTAIAGILLNLDSALTR